MLLRRLAAKGIRLLARGVYTSFRFRCEVLGLSRLRPAQSVKRGSGLGRESEQLANEASLANRISFGQPSHAALPDHVRCLDTLRCPPRTVKGSIALGPPNSLLNPPVVLFNVVIEILVLASDDPAG